MGTQQFSLQLPVFETVNLNTHSNELKIFIGKHKLDYMQPKTLASSTVGGGAGLNDPS